MRCSDIKEEITKKRFNIFVIVFLVFIGMTACKESPESTSRPKDKLAEILERGTIIVATDANFPPGSVLKADIPRLPDTQCSPDQYTANQLEGFDVEVAREIARRLGVEVCFVTPTWTLITGGSWAERWDVSVGSMTITQDRMKYLYFTQPYYSVPGVFFVHKDNTVFSQPRDLSGKRIGVAIGTTHERYLQKKLTMPGVETEFVVENPTIVAYQADTAPIDVVAKGDGATLDAILLGIAPAYKAIENGAPLKQLGDPVFNQHAAIAIDKKHRKDSESLIMKINTAIRAMHDDGTMMKLSKKHHVTDLSKPAGQFDWESLRQFPKK